MSRLAISILIYLSLARVAAASPDYSAPEPPTPPPAKAEHPLDDNLSIAPAPEVQEMPIVHSARYYAYREAINLRAGFRGPLSSASQQKPLIGFDYMFPRFLSPKWEVGADYDDYAGGNIHAGMRWIFHQRSFFRPSLKIAIDNHLDSTQGLASFTDIDNYYLRGSAAIDYTFADPFSIRLEYTVLAGIGNTYGEETLGLSYGF